MLLLPYLNEIRICEHEYDVMDNIINAALIAYTTKANNISNAYKCLKHVSVQTERSLYKVCSKNIANFVFFQKLFIYS